MKKIIQILFAFVMFSFAAHAATKAPQTILVVGDSLSAEYGLKKGDGWVLLLEKKLAENKITATINNASISGETTSGGKSRIDGLLQKYKPTLVIIELGANDAIRGLPLKNTRENLDYITLRSIGTGAKVLIVGMQIPPNFGGNYARDFSAIFSSVAITHKVPLVEFFLKGVADIPDSLSLFQADRAHPNATAQPIMLENVWIKLKKML